MKKLLLGVLLMFGGTLYGQTYIADSTISNRVYANASLTHGTYGNFALGYQNVRYSNLLGRNLNWYGELSGTVGFDNEGLGASLRMGVITPLVDKGDFKILYQGGIRVDQINYQSLFGATDLGLDHAFHIGIFKPKWYLYGSVNYRMGVAMHFSPNDEMTVYPYEQGWNTGLRHDIDIGITGGYRFNNGMEIGISLNTRKGLGLTTAWGF